MADLDPAVTPDNQEPQVPEWVPEKFRSNPEKFTEAYTNLERELTARSQREKELENQVANYESVLAQQNTRPEPQVNNDQLYEAYERDPIGTMAWLAQQAAEQAVQGIQPQIKQQHDPLLKAQSELLAYTVDQMVAQRIPDWNDQKQKVADFVAQRPYLLPESALGSPATTADALEAAYKAMRYDEIHTAGMSREEELRAENERLKRQAQTLSGHPGRPEQTDADNDYWNSVAKVSTGKYGA